MSSPAPDASALTGSSIAIPSNTRLPVPQHTPSEGLYVGLMSGTSLDGVDGVLALFSPDHPAGRALAHAHQAFAPDLVAELLALNTPGGLDELHRSQRAGLRLAQVYADVVRQLLGRAGVTAAEVQAIGVHGQTVRHHPEPPDGLATGYTVQLNQPALLAEQTGIAVVADFRSRDLAAGGQGAPLAPGYHLAAFANAADPAFGQGLAVLNLGGIANWTFLAADGGVTAFDSGPANVLMDAWVQRHQDQAFDRDGHWARAGQVSEHLLGTLLAEPYLQQEPPKSTGRELFNLAWLNAKLDALDGGSSLTPVDVQATLAEFTARTVAQAWRWAPSEPRLARAVVCGGGAFNGHLMRRLGELLPRVTLASTETLGVPPDQVEAMAFAWLAWRFVQGLPGNLPSATGAKGLRPLGALYPA